MTSGAGAFAAALRSARQQVRLTQDALAHKAGIGVRTLRELEQGRASPQRGTLDLILAALELPVNERLELLLAAGFQPDDEDTMPLPPAPRLFGRAHELNRLVAAVQRYHLVTLVGVAGVGKSSLGLAAMHSVAPQFPAGVAGVAFNEISTVADMVQALATVFGVARPDRLAARLDGEKALVLMDGVERNPEVAAQSARWLQVHLPTMHMLATGRHPLGLPAEHPWPVAPLEVPPREITDPAAVLAYPAAAMLAERLAVIRHRPVATNEIADLAALVRRLDGLPLAIELAAGRGRVLDVPEILQRYGDRVLDLTGPDVGSLRQAVAASYDLLEPEAQALLRCVSVFRHRWSVFMAEDLVCWYREQTGTAGDGTEVVPMLERLTSLGLVTVRGGWAMRFRLLDVVRDFAREQAEAAGEMDALRRAHAMACADLAAEVAPRLTGATMTEAISTLDEVASDLRAAFSYAREVEPAIALRLAGALPRWWRFRGRDRETRGMVAELLADRRLLDAPPTRLGWAYLGLAQLAAEHGEGADEMPAAHRALELFQAAGSVSGELAARATICIVLAGIGATDEARDHIAASLELAVAHNRTRDIVVAHNNMCWHDVRRGDLAAAAVRLQVATTLAEQLGDLRLRALVQANLAGVARLGNHNGEAIRLGQAALQVLRTVGDPAQQRRVMEKVGLAAAAMGDEALARQVIVALADFGGCAGGRYMIEGRLALRAGDRITAHDRFRDAAEQLAKRQDARDLVEALVGLVASAPTEARRAELTAELTALCARSSIALLPSDLSLLAGGDQMDADGTR